jgi:hypothetical protein
MAYDASTGQLVLFGGGNSGLLNDTWTWNGTNWTQQFPAASPAPRYYAAMAYDASNGQVVLFGGAASGILGDTWAWNGATWTQQFSATSPAPRYYAAMAYDASYGQVVLFGGNNGYGGILGDTWTWNGTNWTQESPAASPPARNSAAMAYDASNGQVVVFGGAGADGAFLGDTWTWNGTTWTQQSLAASPPVRFEAAMAYDASTGQLVLFGGDGGSGVLADTWTLQLGSVNFGSANICPGGQTTPAPCSQTLALNYSVNVPNTTFGTIKVLTQGAPNLDFTLSSTTCTGAVTAGNSCTVYVQFAPLAPGLRMGAVQLTDSSGNLLITTFVHGIGQGPAIAFGPGAQPMVLGSGLSSPRGVAVDGAGDVFIADEGNNRVVEVPAGGGAQTTVGSGLRFPIGVAVDGAGDVFIADEGNNRVVEVQRSQPPSFNFAATAVFDTSTDSPLSVTVQNIGNQFLVAVRPGLSIGSNSFAQVAGSGTPADCTSSFSLAPGASCNLSVTFIPQTAGSIVSAATFTDSAPNAKAASQSVTLSGNGLAGTVNVTVGTSPPGLSFTVDGTTYTSAQALTWTIGTAHILTATSPQTGVGTQYILGGWSDGTTSANDPVIASSGTTSYTAVFATSSYQLTTAVSPTGAGLVGPPSGGYYQPGSAVGLVATPNPGYAFSSWTGPVANPSSFQTTVTMNGPQSVTANFQTMIVLASQTISFTQAAPASASYYSAFTVAAESTSGLTVALSVDAVSAGVCSLGTSSVASGVTSATVTMLSATGVCTIDANQSGNGVYSAAAQLQTAATAATIGTTLTVTNTNDSGFGSLRDAIANAASGDTIIFSGGVTGTIGLTSGELLISKNLTIGGPGASILAINGNQLSRVFEISSGASVSISGLTIQNGNVAGNQTGGGILDGGALTLSNITLSGNTAHYGGGLYVSNGTVALTNSTVSGNTASQSGGGLYGISGSTLTVTNSTISGNSAIGGGGIQIFSGTLTLTNSTVSGNSASGGGGILSYSSTLTATNSTLSGNSSSSTGGGILSYNGGTATLKNSILANNLPGGNCDVTSTPTSQGYNLSDDATCSSVLTQTSDLNNTPAGLDPSGLKANGGPTQTIALLATSPAVDAIPVSPTNYCTDTNGNPIATDQRGVSRPQGPACDIGAFELAAITVTNASDSGPGSLRQAIADAVPGDNIIFSSSVTGTITLASPLTINTSLTISGPGASSLAISGNNSVQVISISAGVTVTISGVTIENGSASVGGGILNYGMLTVTNGTVSGNSAATEGGGIFNGGTLSVANSTFSGNSTTSGGSGYGGGIFNKGGNTLTVMNSTLSGNSSTFGGGGIYNNGTLTVTNGTISGNSAGDLGSGILNDSGGSTTLKNAIVANSPSRGNCSNFGTIVSQGYNLSDDATCSSFFTQPGDLNSTPAGLDPNGLQNNGGPTQTIALLATSPAVDAIPVSPTNYCTDTNGNPIATDQRGVSRPQGPACDIGAFELVVPKTPVATLSGTSISFGNQTVFTTSGSQMVTLTNTGSATLNISGIATSGPNSSDFAATNTCGTLPASFTPGSGCSFSVPFTPSTVTAESATITITDNAGGSQVIQLSGTGTQAALTITWATPAAITYGTALSGTQLDATAALPGSFAYSPAAGAIPTAGSQTLSVTFTPTDSTDYTTATGSVTLTVNKATPTVTWATPAAIAYGTALSGTQLDATASVPGSFAYSPAAGAVLGGGSQMLSVTFTPTDSTDYNTATGNVALLVNKATPTVTFTGAPATGAYKSTFNVSATTNATSTAVISATGACAITGNIVTMTSGTGSCSLVANWAADNNYATTSATQSTNATKIAATVTFTGAPATAPYLSTFTVAATTSASTTASLVVSGSCSIVGTTVTVTKASGTCSLSSTWATDNNYLAASAAQSTVATKATPVIIWATPTPITYGSPLGGTQLNAKASYNTSPVPGTFAYTPTTGTVLAAGSHTLLVTFTPTNITDYNSATGSVTLVVNQDALTVSWAKPAAITYGTPLSSTQLDASAADPGGIAPSGSFVYTPAAGTVLGGGSHTLSVTFTPNDTTDFAAATGSVTITVNKATPTVTWTTPAAITYGTALSGTQQGATASVAGSFVYTPAAGTVLAGGSHTLSVTFTPTDTTDYATAKGSVTLQVNPATPTITWATPGVITYGTSLSGTQLDATAPAGGTFVYAPAKGTILTAGSYTLSVTFTPNNTADYTTASATVTLQVNRATPKITWAKPAAITYGTALSSLQLDATASAPGSFAYSPTAGAVPGGGSQTLAVTFIPNDTTDYTTANDTVTLVVNQASSTTTINSHAPNPAVVGQAVTVIFSVTGNGVPPTGSVTVTASTGESCSGALSSGAGSCSLTFNTTGSRTLSASYGGDHNFKSSSSVQVTETIQP